MIDSIPTFLLSIGFTKLESGMINLKNEKYSVSYLNVEGNKFLELSENVAGYVLYKIINVSNKKGIFNFTQMLSKSTFQFVNVEETIVSEEAIIRFLSKYGFDEFKKYDRIKKFRKLNAGI